MEKYNTSVCFGYSVHIFQHSNLMVIKQGEVERKWASPSVSDLGEEAPDFKIFWKRL